MTKINGFMLAEDMENILSTAKKRPQKHIKTVLDLNSRIYGSKGLTDRRQHTLGWKLVFTYNNDKDTANNRIMNDYCEYKNIGYSEYMSWYGKEGERWRIIPYKNLMSNDKDIAEKGLYCKEIKMLYLNAIRRVMLYEFEFHQVKVYGDPYKWNDKYDLWAVKK